MRQLIILALVVFVPVLVVQRFTGLETGPAIVATIVLVVLGLAFRYALAKARRAQRRAALISKYGSESEADMILEKKIWTGMTSDQLVDCMGRPEGVDHQHSVRTQKEVWKYHRIGQNRFRNRITVEHGRVIGWTAKQG